MGQGFPSTEQFLQPQWIASGKTAAAVVHVCVGPDGRLTEEPRIEVSSGSERFDNGVIAFAKAGSGHYERAMQDGRPAAGCFAFWVRIKVAGY